MSSVNLRNLYTLYLSILPVISIYRMPGMTISLATVLTAIAMIYALWVLMKRKIKLSFIMLVPLIMYLAYVIVKSNTVFAFLCVALMIHILAISTGCIKERYLRRIIENISLTAAFCVILQQLIYNLIGYHISFFIDSLLIGNLKEQYSVALTTSVIDGLYRPSAFFLEPAHYTQYCIIGLGSTLFTSYPNLRKSMLISLGIISTTSGMGLVSSFVIWGWWYITSHKVSIKIVITMIMVTMSLVFILSNISLTHNIINRLTANPESGDYNAIYGRLWWWNTYFGDFSISSFMFGYGLDSLPEDAYFTGFMKQLYCFGIVGTTLLVVFLIMLIFKSDNLGKACVSIYLLLFFFADLTGYVNMLFYFGVFIAFCINRISYHLPNKNKPNTRYLHVTVTSKY